LVGLETEAIVDKDIGEYRGVYRSGPGPKGDEDIPMFRLKGFVIEINEFVKDTNLLEKRIGSGLEGIGVIAPEDRESAGGPADEALGQGILAGPGVPGD
jgi:hypothetical protein